MTTRSTAVNACYLFLLNFVDLTASDGGVLCCGPALCDSRSCAYTHTFPAYPQKWESRRKQWCCTQNQIIMQCMTKLFPSVCFFVYSYPAILQSFCNPCIAFAYSCINLQFWKKACMISLKEMQHAFFPTAITSHACKNSEYMGNAQYRKLAKLLSLHVERRTVGCAPTFFPRSTTWE